MAFKILVKILCLLPPRICLFPLLKKLEIGVFWFCWRCALQAETESLPIARLLREQATSEFLHAQFFAREMGGTLQITPEQLFARESKKSHTWTKFSWDSQESYQVDGMSTKYIAAKVFFGGKTANSYDWVNKMSFMYVLEEFQSQFYQSLIYNLSPGISSKLIFICNDEKAHAHQLRLCVVKLLDDEGQANLLIKTWQSRLNKSLYFLWIDALVYLLGIPFRIFTHLIKPYSVFGSKKR